MICCCSIYLISVSGLSLSRQIPLKLGDFILLYTPCGTINSFCAFSEINKRLQLADGRFTKSQSSRKQVISTQRLQ